MAGVGERCRPSMRCRHILHACAFGVLTALSCPLMVSLCHCPNEERKGEQWGLERGQREREEEEAGDRMWKTTHGPSVRAHSCGWPLQTCSVICSCVYLEGRFCRFDIFCVNRLSLYDAFPVSFASKPWFGAAVLPSFRWLGSDLCSFFGRFPLAFFCSTSLSLALGRLDRCGNGLCFDGFACARAHVCRRDRFHFHFRFSIFKLLLNAFEF